MNNYEAPVHFSDPIEAGRVFSIETILSPNSSLLVDGRMILALRSRGDGLVIAAERSVPIIQGKHLARGLNPAERQVEKFGIGIVCLTARSEPLEVYVGSYRIDFIGKPPDLDSTIRIESPNPLQTRLINKGVDFKQILEQELSLHRKTV